MSNPYTGTVASAVRKSQLLLASASTLQEASGAGNMLERQALIEGAVLQLWRAFRAFLAEQSHQLQLGVEPETARDLGRYAEAANKVSAEVTELCNLADNPDSWVVALQSAWRGLLIPGQSPLTAAGAQRSSAVNLIPMAELRDDPAAALTAESVLEWQQALIELVTRQRAQGQEW
ncbi:DUF6586 family protein [Microbulbifer celer]|uniref:DUF6586 family protein n=1 Tax=Microbulbifer celer TaxID=435905 RepID=A0ABW3UDU6_9GAMM|nr:DUF6586 family protein [Microbulbifer celer]UFN58955.1 hypothetical protein LPW13_07925 [Microbulbifer celer]